MKRYTLKMAFDAIKKSPLETAIVAFVAFGFVWISLPTVASADQDAPYALSEKAVSLQIEAMQNNFKPTGELPKAELRAPVKYMNMPVTAYNSVPWQTDDTPCIGAQGTDICKLLEQGENTCAANFVRLGTMLEVEGLGTCMVRDRMNARYTYRVDWYMGMDIDSARKHGVQVKSIGIYAKK